MKIYITQAIPELATKMLRDAGHEVDINPETNKILSKVELIAALQAKQYDGVISLLTNQIDADIFNAAPTVKIFANYAVGFNNIDLVEAKNRGIMITNTPGALTDSVAEHTVGLLMAVALRIVEGDTYLRQGKYNGWEPLSFWGADLPGMTIGILGAGRIGYRAAEILKHGFNMKVVYFDVKRNDLFEKDLGATYYDTVEEVLKVSDIVSLHVPLMESTHHLINAERLAIMKPTAYLLNTSRGPVIDEASLVTALREGRIAGAGLDVFENEPKLAPGLAELPNVVMTPHIASATPSARNEMAILAAQNVIDFFSGAGPKNKVI